MNIRFDNLKIQQANKAHLSIILNILDQVTFNLHKKGIRQWDYPWNEQDVLHDIELNHAYILTANEQIIATFFIKAKRFFRKSP